MRAHENWECGAHCTACRQLNRLNNIHSFGERRGKVYTAKSQSISEGRQDRNQAGQDPDAVADADAVEGVFVT